ncbi:MAG: hypothetical protein KM296_00070 [Brockia lithotrophica]|nr:hypothetical protein [Brockia lithotrophica]
MKVHLATSMDRLKVLFSAVFDLATAEEADVIVVAKDKLDQVENLIYYRKPVILLHAGEEEYVELAHLLGIPDEYILDGRKARISLIEEKIHQLKEDPFVPDPVIYIEGAYARKEVPYEEEDKENIALPEIFSEKESPDEADEEEQELPEEKLDILSLLSGRLKERFEEEDDEENENKIKIISVRGYGGGAGASTVSTLLYGVLKKEAPTALVVHEDDLTIKSYFANTDERLYYNVESALENRPEYVICDNVNCDDPDAYIVVVPLQREISRAKFMEYLEEFPTEKTVVILNAYNTKNINHRAVLSIVKSAMFSFVLRPYTDFTIFEKQGTPPYEDENILSDFEDAVYPHVQNILKGEE